MGREEEDYRKLRGPGPEETFDKPQSRNLRVKENKVSFWDAIKL